LFAVDGYTAKVNLQNVQDDHLFVELWVPPVTAETIEFHIPKIVPGTYSISDFGRFLSEVKAFDANGKELSIEKVATNRWKITNAKTLKKISYWVEDSFDADVEENVIFEPAGTNIEEGKNFLLNTFGFFGYLEGMKWFPFEIEVQHDAKMGGVSAMQKEVINPTTDKFTIDSYDALADNPIMYNAPEVATMKIGDSEVIVSVYSPNGVMGADLVMENIKPILEAASNYLGGELPVKKYAFLIYLMDYASPSGGMGALEHMASSVYTLPEINPDFLAQTIRDIAAHEFFHIVTPLNIHSEEIGDFDFINPKMSKHLWLYEGVTEYTAHYVQFSNDLISDEDFFAVISDKLGSAEQFTESLPFTELSLGCLGEHEEEYGNVYQKGALIALCIDLKLRTLSDGEYGLRNLMEDLATKYGQTQSFQDDALFAEIVAMTYPEMESFFERHVAGNDPLPIVELLDNVGVNYSPYLEVKSRTLGGAELSFDPDVSRLFISSTLGMNAFGKDLGYKKGDRLLSLNGEDMTNLVTLQTTIESYTNNLVEGEKVTVVVERKNKKGVWKQKKLKGKSLLSTRKEKHAVMLNPEATEKQRKLFKAWKKG